MEKIETKFLRLDYEGVHLTEEYEDWITETILRHCDGFITRFGVSYKVICTGRGEEHVCSHRHFDFSANIRVGNTRMESRLSDYQSLQLRRNGSYCSTSETSSRPRRSAEA